MEQFVRSNRIRTGYSKGLLIFLGIIMATTAGFFVPLVIIEEFGLGFRILGFIFCGSFFLFALFLFLDTLFHYVYVEKDEIVNVIFFVKKKAKISEITRIESGEGYYQVYVSGHPFCALNSQEKETTSILYQFERHGFNLGSIVKVEPKKRR